MPTTDPVISNLIDLARREGRRAAEDDLATILGWVRRKHPSDHGCTEMWVKEGDESFTYIACCDHYSPIDHMRRLVDLLRRWGIMP